MRHLISSLVAALSFAILACTTVPGDKTLLDFLGDGATTRETALFKLGEPSGTFDRDRILTYRIGSPKERWRLSFIASACSRHRIQLERRTRCHAIQPGSCIRREGYLGETLSCTR
jgi:hypothetical protein